jgi:acetyl-CoA C-acetyltransferase
MEMEKVFILGAARTAIGSFGGTISHLSPADLGAVAASAALDRSGVANHLELVEQVFVGNVLAAGHGMNVARQVARKSNIPVSSTATTINMVCGSGLQAVVLGSQSLRNNDCGLVLAGGVESMSQAGFVSQSSRWGARLGHAELRDLIISDGLTDVFHQCHMGMTAETLAFKYGISRDQMDEFALESQRRAAQAQKEGWFDPEIASVVIEKRGKPPVDFRTDEHVRADTTKEGLAKLRPAFKSDGTVTAGNASGINDGAAFLVLANEQGVRAVGGKPLAEIVGWGTQGVEPMEMGIGPVGAVRRTLSRLGKSISDIDLFEANEAFAVQAVAVGRELELDPARVNVGGGAIALGHPIGASGARILVTLLYHLRRTQRRSGVATLCVGGGQGIAVAINRLED